MSLKIASPDFAHMDRIPSAHTCGGRDISPELRWDDVPASAKSLALVVDDPDAPDPAAPKMTWVHWVLYNMAPDSSGMPAAAEGEELPAGTLEGLNDWKRTGYRGPCPPTGTHRYFFKLYALDAVLPDLGAPTKAKLERAMGGRIVARAELIGLYRRG